MGDVIAFPGGWHGQDLPGSARRPVTAGQPTRLRRELLWREVAGHELREERLRQARTQSDVADRAGVSMQYLSEIERGRKEPSSEVLHAVTGALGLDLLDLTSRVSRTLTATSATRSGPSPSPVLRAA